MSVNQKILDAIELLSQASIARAGYDKTIQAQIISCEDQSIGKYRCKYQDSIFYAYSNNLDTVFTKGTYVYILVPNNDMSKEKTILGASKKDSEEEQSDSTIDQNYVINGINCITSDNIYYLDTEDNIYSYKIYDTDPQHPNYDDLTLDTDSLKQYIKESTSILVGATFKTNIPADRQYRGHYGIRFTLIFKDPVTTNQTSKVIEIKDTDMINNPYQLSYNTRQYLLVHNLNTVNFDRVASIQIFNENFPNSEKKVDQKLEDGDIIISKIELASVTMMSENEMNGTVISFQTPNGAFFPVSELSEDSRTIIAHIKVRGKNIVNLTGIKFYWGIEDISVTQDNENYNRYLGSGWRCLNEKNGNDWNAAGNTYIIKKSDATSRDNLIKAVALYNNTLISKEINIQNLSSENAITIESDSGTTFYQNTKYPTLTCKVNGIQEDDYIYKWAYVSSSGVVENLDEATEAGAVQIVQGNKIINVDISRIISSGTFKCSVYNGNIHLGTGSITLINDSNEGNYYSLIINNGKETFYYNEQGIAPNDLSLRNRQILKPLTFTIFDNLGNSIDDEIIKNPNNCHIRWSVPIKDTLIANDDNNDTEEYYKYYNDLTELKYNILKYYIPGTEHNQIRLSVDYKGIILNAQTHFVFIKKDLYEIKDFYKAQIVLNTEMDNPPKIPLISYYPENIKINYEIKDENDNIVTTLTPNESYQLFNIKFLRNGEEISLPSEAEVKWSMYTAQLNIPTRFTINSTTGKIQIPANTTTYPEQYSHIVKCEIKYNNNYYYDMIPIQQAYIVDDKYKFFLKDQTGFNYAIYNKNNNPVYNNTPFEFICQEQIENEWKDVIYINDTDHNITCQGNCFSYDQNYDLLPYLEYYSHNKNIYDYKPTANRYKGSNALNHVICTYYKDSDIIGKLIIPIVFLFGYEQQNIDYYYKREKVLTLDGINSYIKAGGPDMGQILMAPAQSQALLYSPNFWSRLNNESNIPSSFGSNNYSGQGMLIDLTNAKIHFGSDKVLIDENGILTPKINIPNSGLLIGNNISISSAGTINSWTINTNEISNNGLTLSKTGQINYGNNWSINPSGEANFNNINTNQIGNNNWSINTSGEASFNSITLNGVTLLNYIKNSSIHLTTPNEDTNLEAIINQMYDDIQELKGASQP